MGKPKILATFLSLYFFNLFNASIGGDTITPNQPIGDGGQTLISAGGTFQLGFFSPSGSSNRYVGIWYMNIPEQTVVWVANSEPQPTASSAGFLNLTSDGNLVLHDHNGDVLWSTSTQGVTDPTVRLLDSGNLVLTGRSDNNPTGLVWQSFDHPGNTLLPGMKVGRSLRTNLQWYLTSWKSTSDTSLGPYSYKLDTQGYPKFYIYKLSSPVYRTGPWNGYGFRRASENKSLDFFRFNFVTDHDGIYYSYDVSNESIISRLVLNQLGELQCFVWIDSIRQWNLYWGVPKDHCDEYAVCGVFGVCSATNSPAVCNCLRGFEPKSPQDWALHDYSKGCKRSKALGCGMGDGFVKVTALKLPDTSDAMGLGNISQDECRDRCLSNCSCTAFNTFFAAGSACVTWHGDLIDIREHPRSGQDLYVRLAASELGKHSFECLVLYICHVLGC